MNATWEYISIRIRKIGNGFVMSGLAGRGYNESDGTEHYVTTLEEAADIARSKILSADDLVKGIKEGGDF